MKSLRLISCLTERDINIVFTNINRLKNNLGKANIMGTEKRVKMKFVVNVMGDYYYYLVNGEV